MRVYQAMPANTFDDDLFALVPVGHTDGTGRDKLPSSGDFVEYVVSKETGLKNMFFPPADSKKVVAVVANRFFDSGVPILVVGPPIATITMDSPEPNLMPTINFHALPAPKEE